MRRIEPFVTAMICLATIGMSLASVYFASEAVRVSHDTRHIYEEIEARRAKNQGPAGRQVSTRVWTASLPADRLPDETVVPVVTDDDIRALDRVVEEIRSKEVPARMPPDVVVWPGEVRRTGCIFGPP